jgi:hypothetical protein
MLEQPQVGRRLRAQRWDSEGARAPGVGVWSVPSRDASDDGAGLAILLWA